MILTPYIWKTSSNIVWEICVNSTFAEKPKHCEKLNENKENSKTIFKAIQKLPESQQTAFLLSFVEGMPRQEVAEVMNTSLKAVESLLHRAKQNLRNELDSFYNKAKD